MSNTNLAKKRKSQAVEPTINTSFVFGDEFTQKIKSNIREDLQLLYEKQVEEFNQVNVKLNYLEEQLRTIQTDMKVIIELMAKPQSNPGSQQQEVSSVNRRKVDAIFQSYLT